MDTRFGPTPTLETERLRLRPFRPDDVEDTHTYRTDPEVARYTGFQPSASLAESEAAIRRYLGEYEAESPSTWAICRKDTDRVLGGIGFYRWMPAHRCAEIGFAIARAEWGRGLVPEAARALMRFGFAERGLYRIEGLCHVENHGSARAMEKIGMRFEGILRAYRWKNDLPEDMRLYAMLATDVGR